NGEPPCCPPNCRISLPVFTSQRRIIGSNFAVASNAAPSGEKVSELIPNGGPAMWGRGDPRRRATLNVAKFHTQMVESSPPDASVLPSGEKTTVIRPPPCSLDEAISFPVATSQR